MLLTHFLHTGIHMEESLLLRMFSQKNCGLVLGLLADGKISMFHFQEKGRVNPDKHNLL
jgi:nitrogen regulatory protein PII-like uncharacterized protein